MSELIEPVNLTKEDYWYLWSAICVYWSKKIIPGPSTDRIRDCDYFNTGDSYLTKSGEKRPIYQDVSIVTKFGKIINIYYGNHVDTITIQCGVSDYQVSIDWTKIDDYFPEDVIKSRRIGCNHERTTSFYPNDVTYKREVEYVICDHCYQLLKKPEVKQDNVILDQVTHAIPLIVSIMIIIGLLVYFGT